MVVQIPENKPLKFIDFFAGTLSVGSADEDIISRKEVLDILEFWKVCLLNQEESREKMLDSIIEEVSKMAPAPI